MSTIYEFASGELYKLPSNSHWAVVGVHLEELLEKGFSLDEAAEQLLRLGITTEQLRKYIDTYGQVEEGRLEKSRKFYSEAQNARIQRWILKSPVSVSQQDWVEDANYVANIVLLNVRAELPQWACLHKDGRLDLSRKYPLTEVTEVDELVQNRFLFCINWATSGPGYSWPESYFVSYLPVYNIWVVTASQDSPDVHGYTDQAIAYLRHASYSGAVEMRALEAVKAWWRGQQREWGQDAWEDLLYEGEIDADTAYAARDYTWGAEGKRDPFTE